MKTPIEMLQSIIDMQKENYGYGMETHMKLSDLVEEAEEVVKNHGVSHHVSNCDSDTKDLIEHTKRVLDLIKSKSGIAVKVLSNRVNKKLEQLK